MVGVSIDEVNIDNTENLIQIRLKMSVFFYHAFCSQYVVILPWLLFLSDWRCV